MDFSNYLTPVNIAMAVLGLIAVVLLTYRYMYSPPPPPTKETFGSTSPGTLQQLSSSHVPTEEDNEHGDEERKREMAESDDMTHEQPPL
uniref:Uncharacterized protein n=1 Tax=viral metagenome TaxID=1070528 RepID=A0A6C0I9W7_9ZZZZ